jgi:hypothetical protein
VVGGKSSSFALRFHPRSTRFYGAFNHVNQINCLFTHLSLPRPLAPESQSERTSLDLFKFTFIKWMFSCLDNPPTKVNLILFLVRSFPSRFTFGFSFEERRAYSGGTRFMVRKRGTRDFLSLERCYLTTHGTFRNLFVCIN